MSAARRAAPGALGPLTPLALEDAPELAALELLEHALHVAGLALLARHAHLRDPDAPPWIARTGPRSAEAAASAYFERAHHLAVVLRRYRAAVAAEAAEIAAAGHLRGNADF